MNGSLHISGMLMRDDVRYIEQRVERLSCRGNNRAKSALDSLFFLFCHTVVSLLQLGTICRFPACQHASSSWIDLQHISGVKDARRIQSSFDISHFLNLLRSEHGLEIRHFYLPNAMLRGYGSAEPNRLDGELTI